MATPLELPFPPLVILDAPNLIEWAKLKEIKEIKARLAAGVSICITSASGAANRGGYFFHLKQDGNRFAFYTFEDARGEVCAFDSAEKAVEFINHVTGRKYSPEMWEVAQRVNLRADVEAAGEPAQDDQA